MDKESVMESALIEVGELCKKAKKDISRKFKKDLKDYYTLLQSPAPHGKYAKNYHWFRLFDSQTGEAYHITMFQNNIDRCSGNNHTIFGRIQFVKVKVYIIKNKEVHILKVDDYHKREIKCKRFGAGEYDFEKKKWYFEDSNYTDSTQTVENYDIDVLMREFKKFVEKARKKYMIQ